MKYLSVIMITIIVFCSIMIMSIQSVQIYNLQKEVEKQKVINAKNVEKFEQVREENKRYLDSCLNILENKTWIGEE